MEEIYKCHEKAHEVSRGDAVDRATVDKGRLAQAVPAGNRQTIPEARGRPTVVDEADGRHRVQTVAHLSRCDFLEPIRQAAEEVLPLLAEAEPQVEFQLGLHRPACRAEALLTWQLKKIQQQGLEAKGGIIRKIFSITAG